MQAFTFDALVKCLGDRIKVNYVRSRASTGLENPITPEHVAATGLCFMGGADINSLEDIFVYFHSSTKRVSDMFLAAVDDCDDPRMAVRLPETAEELQSTTSDWVDLSGAGNLLRGLLLCIDGWLC